MYSQPDKVSRDEIDENDETLIFSLTHSLTLQVFP